MAKTRRILRSVFCAMVVLFVRGLGRVVTVLPPVAWGWFAGACARAVWLCPSSYKRNTLKNLVRVGRSMDEARVIGRKSYRSGILVLCESLGMRRLLEHDGASIERRISSEAEDVFARIRRGAEPIAFGFSAHTGSWELMGAELARLCAPTPVVATANIPGDPRLADFVVGLRRGYCVNLVPNGRFLRFFYEQVRRGSPHVYCFLHDQHGPNGVQVPFLGKPACTKRVPAALVYKHAGPVVIGRCLRRAPGSYLVELDVLDRDRFAGLPLDRAVVAIIAECNRWVAESIAAAPEQWIWGHKRWKNCCGPEARITPLPARSADSFDGRASGQRAAAD